jgi:oligoendopeptidase F
VFGNARKNQKKAVIDYRNALALGASVPIPDLFRAAGANFGFDINTMKYAVDLTMSVIDELEEKL